MFNIGMIKENQEHDHMMATMATNIAILTKKLTETEVKKLESTSARPMAHHCSHDPPWKAACGHVALQHGACYGGVHCSMLTSV
ncbi:hypothetical protein HAX54_015360 [Datura stramonium]|uniref:Uncharacterized protein n=1 Tax=Datura stramonium TaxID=4076 RepID=A0ABS8S1C7_DATST|nr:hypothetical protein [Datura stramonium]